MSSPKSSAALRTAVIAITGTVAFYVLAPIVPGISDFVTRYFCSHPLEYISTAMFFTGMAILLQKFLNLKREKSILLRTRDAVTHGKMQDIDVSEREDVLHEWCRQRPKSVQSTQLFQRIRNTLQYLKGSGQHGVEEHLRYLAELASERLHQTYATIRTITWAIPILGFLGTVIGITMAIANVTPEQLDSSLGEVTVGLAVAFDTTALALGMSIVLVFASFAVERSEQQILNDVEQYGIECILPWFGAETPSAGIRTGSTAEMTSQLMNHQATLWAEQLTSVRETWSDVLQQHGQQLTESLGNDVERTLQLHRDDTAHARDAYAEALHSSARSIVNQTDKMLSSFEERIGAWQAAVQQSSLSSVEQSEALHQLGSVLLRMTESGEQLATLQKQLHENLQTLQLASTMEQSANSLTAAVHVLTAKASQRSAA